MIRIDPDIMGQTFGSWTVLSRAPMRIQGNCHRIYWLCRCKCGREQEIFLQKLRHGETKSCRFCAKTIDLIGQRFGAWLVVGRVPNTSHYWECVCECGTKRNIRSISLRNGVTHSCGCKRGFYQTSPEFLAERRKYRLKLCFNMSVAEYEQRLKEQNGCCAICYRPPGKKHLAIDHCHKNKNIRGLLCASCNQGLGLFYDNVALLRAAIEYLEKNQILEMS
jgi:hypothetical protein